MQSTSPFSAVDLAALSSIHRRKSYSRISRHIIAPDSAEREDDEDAEEVGDGDGDGESTSSASMVESAEGGAWSLELELHELRNMEQ